MHYIRMEFNSRVNIFNKAALGRQVAGHLQRTLVRAPQ